MLKQIYNFKKLKAVTLQLFKMKMGTEYYFKFIGPMHLGKEIEQKDTVAADGTIVPAAKRAPATLAHVINLETGDEGQIICSTILNKELNDAYPGESYIGKCFAISMEKIDGKQYNLTLVTEIAEPEEEDLAITSSAEIKEENSKSKKK
jgi:hypothetical protein